MKIAVNRSSPGFWPIYIGLCFSFMLIVIFLVRHLWVLISHGHNVIDLPEIAFESAVYALIVTVSRLIRYIIGKKRYEKNPVDRRKNNLFRD